MFNCEVIWVISSCLCFLVKSDSLHSVGGVMNGRKSFALAAAKEEGVENGAPKKEISMKAIALVLGVIFIKGMMNERMWNCKSEIIKYCC